MPRLFFLLLLCGSSLGMTRSDPIQSARQESVSDIVATPIGPAPGHPRRFGNLEFLSGSALTSADPRFGGISAIARFRGGFVALSDGGTVMWMTGRDGRPSALRLLPLPAGPGSGARKADRDSEAWTRDAAGRVWVSFERHNSVWRYSADLRNAQASRAPPEMRRWRPNSGAEAMVRLRDGRFLVFSEGRGRVPRSSDLLMFTVDPTNRRSVARHLSYRLPAGFSVTDAALLDEDRVITLHRSVSLSTGFVASIGIAPLSAFKPGAVVVPKIIATLGGGFPVDNMEALAVERTGGRTRLWIASDDNYSALQRTLLMEFALIE